MPFYNYCSPHDALLVRFYGLCAGHDGAPDMRGDRLPAALQLKRSAHQCGRCPMRLRAESAAAMGSCLDNGICESLLETVKFKGSGK